MRTYTSKKGHEQKARRNVKELVSTYEMSRLNEATSSNVRKGCMERIGTHGIWTGEVGGEERRQGDVATKSQKICAHLERDGT